MSERTYGSKYDRNLSTVQIAALVRNELKALVKAGVLPKGKYSVRSSSYSMGSSISVKASGLTGVQVYSVARLLADRDRPNVYSGLFWQSVEAMALERFIQSLLAAYNHDGSDIQSDYFDVKFHTHVDVVGDRNAELAALPPAGSPEAERLSHQDHLDWRTAVEARVAELKAAAAPAPATDTIPAPSNDTLPETGSDEDLRLEARETACRAEAAVDARIDACAGAMWHQDAHTGCSLCL